MKQIKMKKYIVIITLALLQALNSFYPAQSFAQQTVDQQDDNVLSQIGDGVVGLVSTILTLNNPVRLEDPKAVFKATEKPQFSLRIPQKTPEKLGQETQEKWETRQEQITADIYNKTDKKAYPVKIKKVSEGQFDLSLEKQAMLTPGKYTLLLSSRESIIYTRKIKQDFNWGVLVVNTKKSVYTKGEVAQLNFGVIDETGHTLCDASLTLKIQNPNETETITLSTTNGKIKPSGECKGDSHTNIADYLAEYQTTEKGIYKLALEAETKNGKYNIEDSFEVMESVPFDVERTKYPSRIYPPAPYDVEINIKANQDYKGSISDVVPAMFDITKTSDNATISPFNNLKSITWQVDFKKGQKYTLSYTIKFPDISPEFYLVGPLYVGTIEKPVFKEGRLWQIASDVVVVSTGIVETEAQFGGLQRKVVYTSESQTATAATNGGTFDGTEAQAAGTGCTWSNASNAQTSNDSYATCITTNNGRTRRLKATNFGFSIPGNPTITGVVVTVEKKAASQHNDTEVKLIVGGSLAGTDKSAGGSWAGTDTVTTYGSSTDVWGNSLDASKINASNFGFSIGAINGDDSGNTVSVDHIQMTVYYTTPTWYAFYNDGGIVTFKKSTDSGSTWGSAVTVSDGDTDNVNPSVGFSENADAMQVFWFDTGANIIEGRRIVLTTGDTQGTLCQSASLGTISSTFMLSVGRGSDTIAFITYSDTSTDTEVGALRLSGLDGACTVTDVTTGNIPFSSGITAGDRPVIQRLDTNDFDVIFQDGDLSYSRFRSGERMD